jgi:hypothetical protein
MPLNLLVLAFVQLSYGEKTASQLNGLLFNFSNIIVPYIFGIAVSA